MSSTSLEKHEADHSTGAHADGGHGEVAHTSHAAVVSYNPDAPSEEWGWHGSWRQFAPKGSRILLWFFTIMMFLMLLGEHVSKVENWYLITFGVGMAYWLLRHDAKARRARGRRP